MYLKDIKDIWKGFGRKRCMEKWCNYIYDIKSKRNHNNSHKPMWPTTSKKKKYFHQRGKSPMTNVSVEPSQHFCQYLWTVLTWWKAICNSRRKKKEKSIRKKWLWIQPMNEALAVQAQEPTFQFVRTHIYIARRGGGVSLFAALQQQRLGSPKQAAWQKCLDLVRSRLDKTYCFNTVERVIWKKHLASALRSYIHICTHAHTSAHNVHSKHVNTHMLCTYIWTAHTYIKITQEKDRHRGLKYLMKWVVIFSLVRNVKSKWLKLEILIWI